VCVCSRAWRKCCGAGGARLLKLLVTGAWSCFDATEALMLAVDIKNLKVCVCALPGSLACLVAVFVVMCGKGGGGGGCLKRHIPVSNEL